MKVVEEERRVEDVISSGVEGDGNTWGDDVEIKSEKHW